MLLRSGVDLLVQRSAYVRLISCSSLIQARQSRQTSKTSPKLLPPEERAKYLRSGEKTYMNKVFFVILLRAPDN